MINNEPQCGSQTGSDSSRRLVDAGKEALGQVSRKRKEIHQQSCPNRQTAKVRDSENFSKMHTIWASSRGRSIATSRVPTTRILMLAGGHIWLAGENRLRRCQDNPHHQDQKPFEEVLHSGFTYLPTRLLSKRLAHLIPENNCPDAMD